MDGIYEFVFIGSHGGGTGKLLIAGGNVLGKDTGGVIYGGSLPDGIGIRAAVPPNMTMVTGEQAGPGGEVVNILAQIDETSFNGQPFRVEIPGHGEVTVTIRKVESL